MNREYRNQLNCKLFEAVPELKSVADSKLAYWGDEEPNSHVVYGDVLAPYLKSADPVEDAELLQRSFDHLETLALHPKGSTAYSVLMTEVLHTIMAPGEDEERAQVIEWLKEVRSRYMGEETRRLAQIRARVFEDDYKQKCLKALDSDPPSSRATV